MHLESTIAWIHERHAHWFLHLDRALMQAHERSMADGCTLPVAQIRYKVGDAAAHYQRLTGHCTYFVCYALSEGREAYDTTIAHEMCHHFQHEFFPGCTDHGEVFRYLLQQVCGKRDGERYHTYDVGVAKKVAELLRLSRELTN